VRPKSEFKRRLASLKFAEPIFCHGYTIIKLYFWGLGN
jgi:hypothetical protein